MSDTHKNVVAFLNKIVSLNNTGVYYKHLHDIDNSRIQAIKKLKRTYGVFILKKNDDLYIDNKTADLLGLKHAPNDANYMGTSLLMELNKKLKPLPIQFEKQLQYKHQQYSSRNKNNDVDEFFKQYSSDKKSPGKNDKQDDEFFKQLFNSKSSGKNDKQDDEFFKQLFNSYSSDKKSPGKNDKQDDELFEQLFNSYSPGKSPGKSTRKSSGKKNKQTRHEFFKQLQDDEFDELFKL
jgi:hypothetical protein